MEATLIRQCQQGDLSQFGTLYESYVEKIYQFTYFKVHHKETAEDLTSRIFMKAMKAIGQFNEQKASFKTWLYQIARNTIIDHYRQHKETRNIDDAWDISDQKVNIERDTDFQMKLESIQKYMDKLKPEQREIILLRVWGGHSFKEIAEIMGKTEAACKMSFKRVMEKLRDDFAPFLILLLLIK